jgi:signal transduction histidine kinase
MTDYLQNSILELKQKEEARTHLLQKVIVVQEEERKRIARELHDETGQTLASLMMGLKCLTATCPEANHGCRLDEMRLAVKNTIEAVHRMAVDLRPSILDDMGLIAAVEKYIADFKTNYKIDADLHIQWSANKRLSHEIEVTVYRIVQEALTNIAKYAEAENVCVIITGDKNGLDIIIEDDGIGFEAEAIFQENAAGNQLGLFGMKERAMLVGGVLTIESTIGRGTTVFLRIPLGGKDE